MLSQQHLLQIMMQKNEKKIIIPEQIEITQLKKKLFLKNKSKYSLSGDFRYIYFQGFVIF